MIGSMVLFVCCVTHSALKLSACEGYRLLLVRVMLGTAQHPGCTASGGEFVCLSAVQHPHKLDSFHSCHTHIHTALRLWGSLVAVLRRLC